jgi:hypothetical protein
MNVVSHRLSPIVAVALALALAAAGCGSSGDGSGYGSRSSTEATPVPSAPPGASARRCERIAVAGTNDLRVAGVGCGVGRGVVVAWIGKPACSRPSGASRFSCSVNDGYRCLGADTERGIAVSCARRGGSVAFLARRGGRDGPPDLE